MTDFEKKFEEALLAFLKGARAKYEATFGKDHYCELSLLPGRKYIKLVSQRKNGDIGGSVEGFIDTNDGTLYKAASWSRPAKGPRANLFDTDHGLGRYNSYGGIS